MKKYPFISKMNYTDHTRVILIRSSEANPRCGDCQSFRLNPTRCILKPAARGIREYNKCDFFKGDSGK
jgi:hypothetical protein